MRDRDAEISAIGEGLIEAAREVLPAGASLVVCIVFPDGDADGVAVSSTLPEAMAELTLRVAADQLAIDAPMGRPRAPGLPS